MKHLFCLNQMSLLGIVIKDTNKKRRRMRLSLKSAYESLNDILLCW